MVESNLGHGFSAQKAHEAQLRMSKRIIFEDKLPQKIRLVAGVDIAYADFVSVGAVVVLDFESLELVEMKTAFCKTRFPYISTLLAFREMEPAILSIGKLDTHPDVFLVDGHGFAHPYHCGFASQLGLVMGRPTIGVAKHRLIAAVGIDRSKVDESSSGGDETLGATVITKKKCRPVYVSVGHMVSLETAVRIVENCVKKGRLPEPILLAHVLATSEKRKINMWSAAKAHSEQIAEL